MNRDLYGAAVIAELCALGAALGINVIDDGRHYVVVCGAEAERFETLLMTAVQVGVLLERHFRAGCDAQHEARRVIAVARLGLLDMDAHDRRIAAAAKAARKAGRRGDHDSR